MTMVWVVYPACSQPQPSSCQPPEIDWVMGELTLEQETVQAAVTAATDWRGSKLELCVYVRVWCGVWQKQCRLA